MALIANFLHARTLMDWLCARGAAEPGFCPVT